MRTMVGFFYVFIILDPLQQKVYTFCCKGGCSMQTDTITNQIWDYMNESPKSTVFSLNDFYGLANQNTIRSALLRMKESRR